MRPVSVANFSKLPSTQGTRWMGSDGTDVQNGLCLPQKWGVGKAGFEKCSPGKTVHEGVGEWV